MTEKVCNNNFNHFPIGLLFKILYNTHVKPMIKQISHFFSSSKNELKKVEWPTKRELMRYTQVVVVASLAIGVYIFVLDSFLTEGLKLLIK